MSEPLRIALLTYRGHRYVGGQGVYVRNLSRELARLGHHVEVLSGQPYPELDDGVTLHRIPSLNLYDPAEPFRKPARDEYRDGIDRLERLLMSASIYPEPLTFSLRAWRWLRQHRDRIDIVHDNQTLAYGTLAVPLLGLPLVSTIHHPITVDRRIALDAAETPAARKAIRRWYRFLGMQQRVARRLRHVATVSHVSATDVTRDFGVRPDRISVTHVGVDPTVFRSYPDVARVPGRIVTAASADHRLKGGEVLLEAVADLRTRRDDVELCVVGAPQPGGAMERAVARLGLADAVSFRSDLEERELARLMSSASVAAVPSLYEGFSLPAAEAMACGTPLVATRAGALPEVVGRDGETGLLVDPDDPIALSRALGRVLDDRLLAHRLGAAGQRRVLANFTWERTARATLDVYARALRGTDAPRAAAPAPAEPEIREPHTATTPR